MMYADRIVEQGPCAALIRATAHPYTRGLLNSRTGTPLKGQRIQAIPGAPPSLESPPPGCAFGSRCTLFTPECAEAVPPPARIADRHDARCIKL